MKNKLLELKEKGLAFLQSLKSKLKNKQKKTKLKGENIHLEPFPTISVLSNPNSNNLNL